MSLPSDPLLAVREPMLRGDYAAAAARLEAHLEASPNDARAWGLLGRCRRELRRFSRAEEALQRSLQLDPGLLASRRELALLRLDFGDAAAAMSALEALTRVLPDDVSLWWDLARIEAPKFPDLALRSLGQVRRLRPQDAEPACFEAQLLLRLGQVADARERAEWVLRQQPDHLDALEVLYWSLAATGSEAPRRLDIARRLASAAPTAERLLNLSQELYAAGEFAQARSAVESAHALAPDFLPARWAMFQSPETPAPEDEAAAARFRQRWREGLERFEQIDFLEPANRLEVWGCVGQSTAFYRHYLEDDLDEQRRYGTLVARMMQAIDPGTAPRPLRKRRRIGFCSAYFRFHTVTRLFAPLIEGLAAHDFELEVFALDGFDDGWEARLGAVARLHADGRDGPGWRRLIAGRELDVLVYPEIGMHPLTAGLAAIRMAPVQVALWGHPVSTGLPTIDYLLSPAAMEPDNAQRAYSERLVTLPGIGHGLRDSEYPEPAAVALAAPDPGRIDLLCAQTVYKLLPRQDALFAAILAALPEACLHMTVDDRQPVREWLHARMAPTLRRQGADPGRQLRMHGFFDFPRFLGLADACRLNLDSMGWSGGMSAIDLLSRGMPVLTLEGPTMRTRQTAALLRRLEVPELIAADADDYVAKAVRLARDDAALAALRTRIRAQRSRLFGSPETLAALADFLAAVTPPER